MHCSLLAKTGLGDAIGSAAAKSIGLAQHEMKVTFDRRCGTHDQPSRAAGARGYFHWTWRGDLERTDPACGEFYSDHIEQAIFGPLPGNRSAPRGH